MTKGQTVFFVGNFLHTLVCSGTYLRTEDATWSASGEAAVIQMAPGATTGVDTDKVYTKRRAALWAAITKLRAKTRDLEREMADGG